MALQHNIEAEHLASLKPALAYEQNGAFQAGFLFTQSVIRLSVFEITTHLYDYLFTPLD